MDIYTIHITYSQAVEEPAGVFSVLNKAKLLIDEEGIIRHIEELRPVDAGLDLPRRRYTLSEYVQYYTEVFKDSITLEKIERNVKVI